MMNRYKMACLAMGLLASFAASGRADELDDIQKAGRIQIATDLSIPPSGMMDANLKPTGSDVETAQLLAKDLGLELVFVQTTPASRIPNLLTKKADITLSTLAITPERAKVVDFTRPYAGIQSVIACVKSAPVQNLEDLKGRSVAVTRGTTHDTYLTNMQPKTFEIARYEDEATLVTAAVSGQADCLGTTQTILNQISNINPSRAFEVKHIVTTMGLGIGVRKDEPRLLEKLDQWVAANLANGKLNEIYKKYHGADLPKEILN
jgi:polar amino acid transport system substrate-binding protein